MANINKIKLSGTTYEIQDLNATKTVELTQAEYDSLSPKDTNTFYVITDATAGDLSNYYTKSETSGATEISTALESKADTATTYTKTETDNAITAATSTKQDTLVSGTNIKTINGETLLGEGNITIQGGSGGGKAIEAGRGIKITTGETADTVSFNLSLSSSTLAADSIVGGYFGNKSLAQYGFAFGDNAKCDNGGSACIALGRNVTANGSAAIALGYGNTAKKTSVAIGRNISTNIDGEISVGQYNVSSSGSLTFGDSGNTLFSVGNGTANNARHNAFEIRQNGDIYISKDGQDVKLQDQLGGGGSITIDPSLDSGSTNTVANSAITTSINEKQFKRRYVGCEDGDKVFLSTDSAVVNGKFVDIIHPVFRGYANNSTNTGLELQNVDLGLYFTTINGKNIFNTSKNGNWLTEVVETSAITTTITSASTDSQVPSAKAVYDQLGGLKLVKLTQSEYDALATKDSSTLYIING